MRSLAKAICAALLVSSAGNAGTMFDGNLVISQSAHFDALAHLAKVQADQIEHSIGEQSEKARQDARLTAAMADKAEQDAKQTAWMNDQIRRAADIFSSAIEPGGKINWDKYWFGIKRSSIPMELTLVAVELQAKMSACPVSDRSKLDTSATTQATSGASP